MAALWSWTGATWYFEGRRGETRGKERMSGDDHVHVKVLKYLFATAALSNIGYRELETWRLAIVCMQTQHLMDIRDHGLRLFF